MASLRIGTLVIAMRRPIYFTTVLYCICKQTRRLGLLCAAERCCCCPTMSSALLIASVLAFSAYDYNLTESGSDGNGRGLQVQEIDMDGASYGELCDVAMDPGFDQMRRLMLSIGIVNFFNTLQTVILMQIPNMWPLWRFLCIYVSRTQRDPNNDNNNNQYRCGEAGPCRIATATPQ